MEHWCRETETGWGRYASLLKKRTLVLFLLLLLLLLLVSPITCQMYPEYINPGCQVHPDPIPAQNIAFIWVFLQTIIRNCLQLQLLLPASCLPVCQLPVCLPAACLSACLPDPTADSTCQPTIRFQTAITDRGFGDYQAG